jgi:hypothetical protein
LQIVQLHRTDAGTYVCVAYNGVGSSVEREINLTVNGKSLTWFLSSFYGILELHVVIRNYLHLKTLMVLEHSQKLINIFLMTSI